MLTLVVQHCIYLSRQQRYDLHEQKDVDTTGISIPVWYLNDKTSEPAYEVICNYYLRNPKKEVPIKIFRDGYLLSLPHQIPRKRGREISDEEWRNMSQEQREAYYTAIPKEMSSASLLDVKDGGSETLMYRENNTIKNNGQFMKIVHYVNIYDMKYLEGSIEYVETKKKNEGNETGPESSP